MSVLVAGLVLFLGVHLVPVVPSLRARMMARWGERPYRGRFSVISAIGLVLIVVGYARAEPGGFLFAPFPGAIRAAPWVVTVALILFAAANMRTHIRAALRHPMLLGLLLWSLVHLLANGEQRATVLFGSFLAYAVIDLASAASRGAVKSFTPAWSHDVMAVVGGVMVAAAVMHAHEFLFGVPAIVRAG
jgi:uncharacterized membrane protein